MSEAQTIEVESASHMRNMSRVQRDEQELAQLLKDAGIKQDDEEQEASTEEATQEESSSPKSVEAPVPPTSDTKQEETPEKAEASTKDDADLSAEEKSFKKRYSDIRKYMQEKDAEYKAELDKLKGQLDLAAKNELVLPK